jgi:hypothetical protein
VVVVAAAVAVAVGAAAVRPAVAAVAQRPAAEDFFRTRQLSKPVQR